MQKKCFCYKDAKDSAIELKEFVYETTGNFTLVTQEVIFIINGSLQVTVENSNMSRKLKKGEFIFMPVGTSLSYKVSKNTVILTVKLIGELPECHVFRINRIINHVKKKQNGLYTLKINDRMRHFIVGMMETIKDGLKCKIYMQMEVCRMLFLIHAYYSQEECLKFFSAVISCDVKFSEFVRQNYTKYRTIGELADSMSMTTQQFSNRFRKVFGKTPREWIQREKAHMIYQDICKSNKLLKEIAFEYGFSMQSNFIRYCRATFGASPGEIRKSLLNMWTPVHTLKKSDDRLTKRTASLRENREG